MPRWFPKPPPTSGDVLASESWIDFLFMTHTGNRWMMAGVVVLGLVLAVSAIFSRSSDSQRAL